MLPVYTPSLVVGRMVIWPPTLKLSPGAPELVRVTLGVAGASGVNARVPPRLPFSVLAATRIRTTALLVPRTLYCAVVGVPAEAFRNSKQRLRSAMEGVADSVMLVSEPFAVAYGLEALLHALIIDIGAGTADFCVMQGRYPTEEDQRTLPNAGDSIDEQLLKLVREHHPEAQTSIHMIREWKEKWSFVGEAKQPVVVSVPVKGKATDLDITAEMRAACESILAPVCETMLDLLTRVEPEYQSKVRNNVILAGGTSLIVGLSQAIEKALTELGGGHATVVEDPVFAGSDGGLAIARDASSSDWEKLSL